MICFERSITSFVETFADNLSFQFEVAWRVKKREELRFVLRKVAVRRSNVPSLAKDFRGLAEGSSQKEVITYPTAYRSPDSSANLVQEERLPGLSEMMTRQKKLSSFSNLQSCILHTYVVLIEKSVSGVESLAMTSFGVRLRR